MAKQVWAIVVLYHPEPGLVEAQYAAVQSQVDRVVYVDNGGGREALSVVFTRSAEGSAVEVIGDGVNLGLGAALNAALERATQSDAAYALLLDQDSIPEPDMVANLRRGFDLDRGTVLAVGPAILDELTGRLEYFARLGLPVNRRVHTAQQAGAEFFDVDFLITSGTLVQVDLLAQAGVMDAELFIDSIDFDWSFHARSRGFRLLATFSAVLRHRRGDDVQHLPGGRVLRLHSSTRAYYMHRNRVRLYRRPYVPLAWKVHDVVRMVVKLAVMAVFAPDRRGKLTAALRGLRDGLR